MVPVDFQDQQQITVDIRLTGTLTCAGEQYSSAQVASPAAESRWFYFDWVGE